MEGAWLGMSTWHIEQHIKVPKLVNPICIEGLPGIGNVGKLAVDFLIEELKAEKISTINASSFPHTVFVNEDNLVDLPVIEMYLAKVKQQHIIFMTGDMQPSDEESCYEFCFTFLDMLRKWGVSQVVTIGGIGLQQVPEEPRVFCTGNKKKIIKEWTHKNLSNKIYGVVGPIVGVSGLMVGLASRYDMQGIALLAETFGHPMYIGVKGSRAIVSILIDHFKLKVDIKKLDKEIKEVESELTKRTEDLQNIQRETAIHKLKGKIDTDQRYIG